MEHSCPPKNLIFLNLLAPKNLINLFYTLGKTSLGETGCLSNLYYLLAAQASSFLIHPANTLWEIEVNYRGELDTFGTLPLIVQYLCDLKEAMIHHWSPITFNPTLPKEAEDFSCGGKYP